MKQCAACCSIFLSTSPLRGTTILDLPINFVVAYFYPRPPCGGRRIRAGNYCTWAKFLSTSPLRGTTVRRLRAVKPFIISIHVPLAGDDPGKIRACCACTKISIHVPLAGDDGGDVGRVRHRVISIHVPLAGDDVLLPPVYLYLFYFYPRPPCGGRRPAVLGSLMLSGIFLSTSPLRGTTPGRAVLGAGGGISIHVPLAGDDVCRCAQLGRNQHFYPRPPCGGRRGAVLQRAQRFRFLSTSPLRGTTIFQRRHTADIAISIHVPLAGDDTSSARRRPCCRAFLSTSPLRGTTEDA